MNPSKKAAVIQRNDRRRKAFDLALQGLSYRQIGTRLGVSRNTIMHDVRAVESELDRMMLEKGKRSRLIAIEKRKKIQHEAWEAWRKSQQPEERTTTKLYPAEVGEDTEQVEEFIRTEIGQAGDNQFLLTILKAAHEQEELEGLHSEEGKKSPYEVNFLGEGPIQVNVCLPDNGRGEPIEQQEISGW